MIKTIVNNELILMDRPLAGHNSNKFNRAAKLLNSFRELDEKFSRMIDRGDCFTLTARLALACRFMMYTGIRIGNESSAEGYMTKPHPYSKEKPRFVQTYGLTTLRKEHFKSVKNTVRVYFVGKKQVDNYYEVKGELAQQVRKLLASNSETVFDISAYELTKFIKKYVGKQFSPKDFRTMRANIEACTYLNYLNENVEAPVTKKETRAEVREICEVVSEKLCNTHGICKKSYIDEMFWNVYNQFRY